MHIEFWRLILGMLLCSRAIFLRIAALKRQFSEKKSGNTGLNKKRKY